MDTLGATLLPAGEGGLPYAEAMTKASLSLPRFLGALGVARIAGIVETFEDASEQKLRLTALGKSLY